MRALTKLLPQRNCSGITASINSCNLLTISHHRLYLVMEEGVRETPPPVLEALGLRLVDFTVVDMGLSEKALEFHLLKFILRLDHPEYAARHRALLVDQTFYEDQIATSKVGSEPPSANNYCRGLVFRRE